MSSLVPLSPPETHVCGLIRGLGWKIPAQIGFATLAASARDVPHLAGVDERPADVGVSAIDLLVAQLQREEFGLPVTRRLLIAEGSWIPGGTVRVVPPPRWPANPAKPDACGASKLESIKKSGVKPAQTNL